jgi:hypothetical protein
MCSDVGNYTDKKKKISKNSQVNSMSNSNGLNLENSEFFSIV